MAVQSYTEQLERVQSAIADVETRGQAYDVNGRTLNRADLESLYAREDRLLRKVSRQARGGIRARRGYAP